MYKTIFYFGLIALIFACRQGSRSTGYGAQKDEKYKNRIDSLLTKLDSDQTLMGSVSLTKNGEVVYSRAIGFKDLDNRLKANTKTKYRIGSITKAFTAVLVFKAIEENKIQLDQTIGQFFPELRNGDRITIAHLLHHQSGIQSYTKDEYFWDNRTREQTAQDMLTAIYGLESMFEPGENTEYSNSNYFLLTEILEKVFHDSYADLLNEYIISPLQLENTLIGDKIQPEKNESLSYIFKDGKWEVFAETHMSLAKGSGSMVSTPEDLSIFFRSLLNGKLLSIESLERMTTIIRNHGMGLFSYKLHDQSGFGHGGVIDGFTAFSVYFKDLDLALSITSNASEVPVNEVFSKILELYLGQPVIGISEDEIDTYTGVYSSLDDPGDKAVFERTGNTLTHVILGEFRTALVYKGSRRFLFNQMYGPQISFTFSEDGQQLLFEQGNFKATYQKE